MFSLEFGCVAPETALDALNTSNMVVEMDISGGHSGVIRRSFGGIRILFKEFGTLAMFCDVAVHMNGPL